MNFRYLLKCALFGSVFIISSNVCALEFSAGLKGGINLAKFYGASELEIVGVHYDPYKNQVMKPGFMTGAVFQFKVSDKFALQPELLFSSRGQKINDGTDWATLILNYVEIPILTKFLIPIGVVTPTVYAGPSLAFRIGKINRIGETGGIEIDMDDNKREVFDKYYNKFDLGISVGGSVGTKVGPGSLIADIRYTLGLLYIEKLTSDLEAQGITKEDFSKHSVLTFGLGYLFAF
jgi:hypothetical protein